jgi:acetyl-CoA carboxylase biotin carboxylase subunit
MREHKIKQVLIANRGEIAVRIQRACRKLGIGSVSVASEADARSYFARQAEELVVIGPAAAKDSYLNIEKIVRTAVERGCDAVHPGYGFLSENADFARAVIEAGLIFVGPDPASIDTLGSKTKARAQVTKFGVPCTPGTSGDLDDAALVEAATAIGFPVIIKAVAGGGGRGMRVVQSADEMTTVLPRARGEALKNFSNAAVYAEKYIAQPRHVEVQVFGDAHGNVVHFGTRDCSSQRRHQKLIEEAPAPLLSPAVRSGVENAAVQAARSVGYKNAGTAEFLVCGNEYYFLEMNTRIQVEHPVTELVTGVDLVELQLRVAQGEPIPYRQEEITTTGHAIEFRIYAEDPLKNFAPAIGRITSLERPTAPHIREDYGCEAGDEISPHYDAMISKLIVTGATRAEAIERSLAALSRYSVGGLATTLDFHRWLLREPAFRRGGFDIGYVERTFTPESIRALRASEIRDPRHRAPVGDAEVVEFFRYRSAAFDHPYLIEVAHRASGVFEARPYAVTGEAAPPRFCRASNGLETALRALEREVLEVVPPKELFA